ncbi:alpha-L-rhamnosidase [Microbacterium sp. B35-04]|uniref:alpha-L-rhamnosidase n=1 Tax=unclassified Microbacterium TaxID=2609290 RepID=UPI0013D53191|nr:MULTISPECIES: alpha-L-rhamnosidase [unclassified Microbacterium]KAF2414929.1 alpha-L-rhamnosidase [Microbacterium sp. B35-04]KAF2418598.1 alpha-L-rhamnosidase [Microbacterium sp. B35-30]
MSVTVDAPRIEHHREPVGIGERMPRLSWRVASAPSGWRQTAFSVEVDRDGDVTTYVVDSPEQVLVDWPAAPLRSREIVTVRIAVRGEDGAWSAASVPTVLEAGLLEPGDWVARPVGAFRNENPHSDERRPSLVRRGFEVRDDIVRARLYATAHGVYEAELNGERVGDDTLSPGWTVYGRRLRYYTYDVTDLVRPGANALGAWLGDGWYRGRLGWRGGFRNVYGYDQSFLGQLELTYADGSREVVATDASWRSAPSPILHSGLYDGEDYDAREEQPGWSTADFDDSGWEAVQERHRDPATLVAPTAPPVRATQELRPIAVLAGPSGSRILDFGQNLVGRVRIRVSGDAGTTVTLRTAEVMQDGEIYTRPLRAARSTDNYTLAGRDVEEWEPRFTFHGFRYVEVTGWPGDLDADAAAGALVARVYHTDLERTGWFESSDPALNRLHENVLWGMRGNFVDIPTDCPQRDERIGWTGDIQVFGPTASTLYDVSGMLSGWLRDLAIEQLPDGTVPWYVPVIPAVDKWTPMRPGAAWGDVATLLPWTLYERFGDVGVVRTQFDSARRWVDLLERLSGRSRLWDTGFQLGDWLDPAAPPDDPADALTDRYLVATAYFAKSARTVARMAEVLGLGDERAHYDALADEVAAAFDGAYVNDDGTMTSDAQTAYALGLRFDLITDPQKRDAAAARLAQLVHQAGNRIATGFVGTPLVSDALSAGGHVPTAYDLILERECPSWLYQVEQGATTVWERWDSLLPDGTVNPGQMTSFNHYALGAVADWMHRVVGGLAPDAPGYRRIRFAPRPGGGLTSASARQLTAYGEAAISWRTTHGQIHVEVTVPVGAEAVLDLEGSPEERLSPGTHTRVVDVPVEVGAAG